jgi:dipeptidyl aminopeptidase/acylaminoacyl peptidase
LKGITAFILFTSLILSVFTTTATELPVESFSQLPSYTRPNLSPSGQKIAFIGNLQNPQIAILTTVDLQTGEKKYLFKSDNEDSKVNWFKWANEKTLIVSVRFAGRRYRTDTMETRLLAIDINTKDATQRNLVKPRSRRLKSEHYSQVQDNVVSFLPDDPDHILIALDLDVANLPSVYKLNILTGRKNKISRGKLAIRDWMADRQGNLRLGEALNYKTGEASIRVLIGDDDKWHKIFEYNALEEAGVTVLGFAKDPNILYYNKYHKDKKALFSVHLPTMEETLVFADEDYDVDGSLIYSRKTRDVIGIHHSHSPNRRIYWDNSVSKFQEALNQALPDSDNYLVDFSEDENTYLLYTENDFTPGIYYLGDRKAKTLREIFGQYPDLVPEVLSEHKLVSYIARDGTKIEGYLTVPKNTKGPVPTILHPHGGPGARESDGFDYWTSFFANRGYAVFRPNFRGSTGYGYEFAQSQMRGWGLTMQDDLTDAAHWLVAEKIADPQRMCIVGASYGGYAATMATVKTPDLFKCAVSFAGVMNLKALVRKSRNFVNSKFVKKQIGDDSDDLKARSPYYQAAKIKTPILLLHGEDDRVVDVEQSRKFAEELKDLGKSVEYIEFKYGDHYLSIQRNRHAAFKAMDRFLKQHLHTTD